MVNYNNGKVYKIWSTAGDKIYIGSTTKEYLSQRMDTHRTNYKSWKNGKRPLTTSFNLFEEYGLENCFIELLEAKVCNSSDEMHQLEGKYIRSLCCVNKNIAGRTDKQYREEHKEQIKDYREEHKENSKLYYKDYREENKDKIKELDKKYREDNRDKIREHKNTKTDCDCGSIYSQSNKSRHIKTIKHCQFIGL